MNAIPFMNSKYIKVVIASEIGTVSALMPEEFSIIQNNNFESLADATGSTAQAILSTFKPDASFSFVPYTPQVWMGSDPLKMGDLTLHFIATKIPKTEVHGKLLTLLAMASPRDSTCSISVAGATVGMLLSPVMVSVTVGGVLRWPEAFIQSCEIKQNRPWNAQGFSFHGEARITIISKNFVMAQDILKGNFQSNVGAGTSVQP